MRTAQAITTAALEKPDREVQFIPIVRSAPLIYAHCPGFFERNSLQANLAPVRGFADEDTPRLSDMAPFSASNAFETMPRQPLAALTEAPPQRLDYPLPSAAREPFLTTKPEGKGTGLGIPLCVRLLEAHEGALALESEAGVGTTVRRALPLRARANGHALEDHPQPGTEDRKAAL